MVSCGKPNRKSKSKSKRCARRGPVTNNPFLNFLRGYRRTQCGVDLMEISRRAARVWNKMDECAKRKFKFVRRRRRSSSCKGASRKKCMRPGPVTRNPYLNFLREYRKKHCGLGCVQLVIQASKVWNRLSPDEKCKYVSKIKKSARRRRPRPKC